MGIDVAGAGPDETTFQGFNATNPKYIYQNLEIHSNTISGPDIERQIETLKNKYKYNRRSIGFDSGGFGSGTFAYMMENDKLTRLIVAVDHATRPTEYIKDGRNTKLIKEYTHDLLEELVRSRECKCLTTG